MCALCGAMEEEGQVQKGIPYHKRAWVCFSIPSHYVCVSPVSDAILQLS